jgi:hypothetical protein
MRPLGSASSIDQPVAGDAQGPEPGRLGQVGHVGHVRSRGTSTVEG